MGDKSTNEILNRSEGFGTAKKITNSADMTTAAEITDAPDADKKLVLTDLLLSVDTEMNVTLKEETSGTTLAGPYYLAARQTVQITPRSRYLKVPTADKKIEAQASVAGNITIETWTYSEE